MDVNSWLTTIDENDEEEYRDDDEEADMEIENEPIDEPATDERMNNDQQLTVVDIDDNKPNVTSPFNNHEQK